MLCDRCALPHKGVVTSPCFPFTLHPGGAPLWRGPGLPWALSTAVERTPMSGDMAEPERNAFIHLTPFFTFDHSLTCSLFG